MPVMSNSKRMMAMKLETTSGTAETLVNADCDLHFFDITVDAEIEHWVNQLATGRHSFAVSPMGKRKITIGAKHAMRLGASVAVAPKLSKAFKACGQTETVVAVTSVAWTPDALKDEGDGITATIKVYYVANSGNSVIVTAKGCMGNAVVSMDDLGQPLVASFTFTGAFVGITDGAALTVTSPDTSIPPAIIGSAVTTAAVPQQIAKFTLDFGNQVELDYDPAETTGYSAAYIAKRIPKIMMDPKMKLLSVDAHYTRWSAGTEAAISVATAGVSSMKFVVAAPKGQLVGNKMGDRNEAGIFDQEYELHENAGNDSHSISQVAA